LRGERLKAAKALYGQLFGEGAPGDNGVDTTTGQSGHYERGGFCAEIDEAEFIEAIHGSGPKVEIVERAQALLDSQGRGEL